MAFRGSTYNYHYLTDGDGFPTNIKYQYWKRFSYISDFSRIHDYGVRSIEEESIENGAYVSMNSIPVYGLTGRHNQNDRNVKGNWHNARRGSFRQGAMNYIPMTAEEAVRVYWGYRGMRARCNRSTLSVSGAGGSVSIQTPSEFDSGDIINAQVSPPNRIWQSRTPVFHGYSEHDSFDETWKTEPRVGNVKRYRSAGFVSAGAKVYTSWNQMVRFPKSNAGRPQYGFEHLFEANFGQSFGQEDDYDENGHTDGSIRRSVSIDVGSAIYWPFPDDEGEFSLPENDQNEYFTRKTVYKLKKATAHGVPVLCLIRQFAESNGAYRKDQTMLDIDIDDIYFQDYG